MGFTRDWKKGVTKKDAEQLLTDPNAGNKKAGQSGSKTSGGKKK